MVFRLFSSSKSMTKRYKKYVGKPVVLANGDSVGVVDSITLSKRDMRPLALVIKMRNGATRELDLSKVSVKFEQDRVIIDAAPLEVEYNTIINTLRSETNGIKERIRDIMDKLNKLSDLLIQGGIKEDLYRDIRERLERERSRWVKLCNDKLSSIEDIIIELDKKINDAERRRGELMIRRIMEELEEHEAKEVDALETLLDQLRKTRSDLVMLKMELQAECY